MGDGGADASARGDGADHARNRGTGNGQRFRSVERGGGMSLTLSPNTSFPAASVRVRGSEGPGSSPSTHGDTDGIKARLRPAEALPSPGVKRGAGSAGVPTPVFIPLRSRASRHPSLVPDAPFPSRVERRPAAETASHVSAATLLRPAPEAREMEIV